MYRDLETNVSTNFYPANLDFHTGSVVWWFNPDWSSANSDGNGPGNEARLIDAAFTNGSSTYEWWVAISADGTKLTFNTSSNGVTNVAGVGADWLDVEHLASGGAGLWHDYGTNFHRFTWTRPDRAALAERDAELAGVRHDQLRFRRRERFFGKFANAGRSRGFGNV